MSNSIRHPLEDRNLSPTLSHASSPLSATSSPLSPSSPSPPSLIPKHEDQGRRSSTPTSSSSSLSPLKTRNSTSNNLPNQSAHRHSVVDNLNSWIEDQLRISPLNMIQSITSRFTRAKSDLNGSNLKNLRSKSTLLSPKHRNHSLERTESYNSASCFHSNQLVVDEVESQNNDEQVAQFLNSTRGFNSATPKELIELAKFGVVELENVEKGVGHSFEVYSLPNPTWCDSCGDFMWTPVTLENCMNQGSYFTTVHCTLCKYTCHARCRKLVRIDCKVQKPTGTLVKQEIKPEITKDNESENQDMNQNEKDMLIAKITNYNSRLKNKGSGLGITLLDSGNFRGFIRVHLNLTRPINVVAGTRPPSIYDIIKEDDESANAMRRTLTSFYMPRDTVKNIHITSELTTLDVIKSLLKKFKVVDNPQKFALYQCYPDCDIDSGAKNNSNGKNLNNNNNSLLIRIGDHDKPLRIALDWLDSEDKKFVLQENDAMDIAWEAFALPELNNFLVILKKEEEEHVNQVRIKFANLKYHMQRAMKTRLMIHSDGGTLV